MNLANIRRSREQSKFICYAEAHMPRAESTSKCNTGQNYNKSLKNSSFGVEKFNFSLGLRLIFNWTE